MNRTGRWSWVIGFVLVLTVGPQADAGLVQIGTQHFADGQLVDSNAFAAAVVGQVAPFNGFLGSDLAANLTTSYGFAFNAQTISAATFTLGIFDGDSAAPGDQVGSFSINGIDLTALLNTAFNGHGGTQQEYDVYTITLPSTVLVSIASGTANIGLTLAGPGLAGNPGDSSTTTTYNGAGLDFSNLNITPASVPEPSSLALVVIAGAVGVGFRQRRRSV